MFFSSCIEDTVQCDPLLTLQFPQDTGLFCGFTNLSTGWPLSLAWIPRQEQKFREQVVTLPDHTPRAQLALTRAAPWPQQLLCPAAHGCCSTPARTFGCQWGTKYKFLMQEDREQDPSSKTQQLEEFLYVTYYTGVKRSAAHSTQHKLSIAVKKKKQLHSCCFTVLTTDIQAKP